MPKARHDYNYTRNIDEEKRIYNRDILPLLRLATPEDYVDWLAGYIFNNGKITYSRSRALAYNNYYVVLGDLDMVPLFGSSSIDLIIPNNINITVPKHSTHSNFFFMKDYSCIENTHTELFVDHIPLLVNRGITYIQMLDCIASISDNFIYQFIDLVPPKDLPTLFNYLRYPIVGELAKEKYNQSIVTVRAVGKRYPIETVLENIIEENTYIDRPARHTFSKVDQIVESMKSGKSYIEAKTEVESADLNTFLDEAESLDAKETNIKPYIPKHKPNRYTAIELDIPKESLLTKVKKFIRVRSTI